MLQRKLKGSLTIMLTVVFVFLVLFTSSIRLFSANGASIAMTNHYPDDGGTYEFVDHFVEQTTAVNTNTTVSVSIDGGAPIPMTYQGIKNEIAPGDTVARDWYTWNITVPAITAPGNHTFQFFRHYYVWQEADHYWAEFNAHSTVQSFNIGNPSVTPSPSPPPATMDPAYIYAVIAASAITAFLVLVTVTLRKRTQRRSPTV
jgi:hypothetical protein